MIKKISLTVLLLSVAACSSIKEKAARLKNINDTCPPQSERSLKDIFCKESK